MGAPPSRPAPCRDRNPSSNLRFDSRRASPRPRQIFRFSPTRRSHRPRPRGHHPVPGVHRGEELAAPSPCPARRAARDPPDDHANAEVDHDRLILHQERRGVVRLQKRRIDATKVARGELLRPEGARDGELLVEVRPGFSEASGALIRITVYGFGGVTARYRLSVFFPPVAPLAPCIAPPAPFDSETPSLSDPSDAAVVSSPHERRFRGTLLHHAILQHATVRFRELRRGGLRAHVRLRCTVDRHRASVSSPMPVSAFHCLRTHARVSDRAVSGRARPRGRMRATVWGGWKRRRNPRR